MKKILLIIALSTMFIGCLKTSNYAYKVTGSGGPFNITYTNEKGGTSQATAASGWTYKWSEKQSKRFRYLSAQCSTFGSVKVDIIRDGKVIQTSSSTGNYVIASCKIP